MRTKFVITTGKRGSGQSTALFTGSVLGTRDILNLPDLAEVGSAHTSNERSSPEYDDSTDILELSTKRKEKASKSHFGGGTRKGQTVFSKSCQHTKQ